MPLTPSAREFVPPVPSAVTKATTTNTTTTNTTTNKDDEKKNSFSQNSNSNANFEKKKKTTTNDDDEGVKLPSFDLTPHDAFKTDFQIGQKQVGVTPIVHAKKFSKAIAIKKP